VASTVARQTIAMFVFNPCLIDDELIVICFAPMKTMEAYINDKIFEERASLEDGKGSDGERVDRMPFDQVSASVVVAAEIDW